MDEPGAPDRVHPTASLLQAVADAGLARRRTAPAHPEDELADQEPRPTPGGGHLCERHQKERDEAFRLRAWVHTHLEEQLATTGNEAWQYILVVRYLVTMLQFNPAHQQIDDLLSVCALLAIQPPAEAPARPKAP